LDFGPPGKAGRVAAGSKSLSLDAGAEAEASFEYRTAAAGILGVTLTPHDAFPADDHAELEMPAQPTLAVVVYTREPELLKPVLSSNPRVTATYRLPEQYRPDDRGLVILDRFIPAQRPAADSLWIDPPSTGSPIPIRTHLEQAVLSRWDSEHPAAAGLHARDFRLDKVSVFETGAAEDRVGEASGTRVNAAGVDAGPVIVTRSATPKIVALGFHPALSPMRYELAMPLLFANLLRWVSPEIFRRSEISGGSVGSVKLVMDQAVATPQVKVTADDGSDVPFTLRDPQLDEAFLTQARAAGLVNLEGHRTVGGMRASLYNAMPLEGVQALVAFMQEFERRHG
jgi:hypothetical protein